MAFNLDNYEDVQSRVKRFQEAFPVGRIVCDVIQFDAVKGHILVAASVYREHEDTLPAAVDYAFGDAATYPAQMRKFYVEDTCTSSIGRSLSLILETTTKATKITESKIMMSLTDAVAIEEEDSIMLDHDYDGIKELDNNLPPWWKYGFYLTIVTGVIYLLHFHVFKTGDLQGKEYDNAIAQAKIEVDEFMKTSANNVDENTVKVLTEASDITAGKDLFIANCVACHGKGGEGTVGPNLTDEYWIHGGSIKDLFKTLKYGWVEKGMKSWKDDLSPIQMAQVSSYIRTLKGTNPPNPKAPQGDLYSEAGVAPLNDSTIIKNDSLNINIKADSVNVGKK